MVTGQVAAAEGQTASDQTIIDQEATKVNAVTREEDEPPKVRTCEPCYCKGEAVEIGRLKGQ